MDTDTSTESTDTSTEPTAKSTEQVSNSFNKLTPGKKFKLLGKLVGKIDNVQYHKEGTVSIQIASKDAEGLLGDKEIDDYKLNISKNYFKNRVRGLIQHQVVLDSPKEEITENLESFGVLETSIKEKPKRDENDKVVREDNKIVFVPSHTAILSFEREALPKFVVLFGLSVPVYPYYPDPIQCKQCFDYGHTTKKCLSKIKLCGWCSQLQHVERGEKCGNEAKCKHCSEDGGENKHSNFNKECPKYVREEKIAKLKETNKLNYWEAAKIVDGKDSGNMRAKTMAQNIFPNSTNRSTEETIEKNNDLWHEKLNKICGSFEESMQENNQKWNQKLTQMSEMLTNTMTRVIEQMKEEMIPIIMRTVYNTIPSTLPIAQQQHSDTPSSDMEPRTNISDLIQPQCSFTAPVKNYTNYMLGASGAPNFPQALQLPDWDNGYSNPPQKKLRQSEAGTKSQDKVK